MDLMPRTEEARLTAAVEQMIDMVSDGASPTDALMKASSDFGDRAVARVAELYNQSRTMFKLSGEAGRAEPFELADADTVVSLRRKQASTGASRKPEVSTPHLFDFEGRFLEVLGANHQAKAASAPSDGDPFAEEEDGDPEPLFALREKLASAFERSAEQLRTVFNNDGFHSIEAVVLSKLGEDARPVLDALWGATRAGELRQKRASKADVSRVTLTDLLANTCAQAASVERMVDMSVRYHKRAALRARKAAQAAKQAQPLAGKPAAEKSAELGSSMWSTFNDYKGKGEKFVDSHPALTLTPKARAPGEAMLSAARDMEDPSLDRSIQQLRVRAGLSDMLANDEVISGYSEDEVTDAFNQVAQVAPTAVENKAVLRDLLRRALTGGISSFDVGQAVNLSSDIDSARAGGNTLVRGDLPYDVAGRRPALPNAGAAAGKEKTR